MLGICAPLRTQQVVWALRQSTARAPQRLPCRVAFAQRFLATHAPQPPPVASNGSSSEANRASSTSSSQFDSPSSKPDTPPPLPTGPPAPKPSVLSRVLPASVAEKGKTASSARKIIALAKPERKPLAISIGLLTVSSAVSMSIPFTVGRLIDFFTSPTPVSHVTHFSRDAISHAQSPRWQQIPLGLSLGQASALLFLMFTVGAAANAGRAMLMRISGQH